MEKINFFKLANFTPKQKLFLEFTKNYRYTLLGGVVGTGKALKLEEDILTPYGFKKLKDLKVGDLILNPDGDCQTIVGYYPQGIKKTYRVYFSDGAHLDCSEDHLWLVRRATFKRKTKAQWRVLPTKFLIGKSGYYIPINEPLKFNFVKYRDKRKIHPYVLGVLLGDGTFRNKSTVSFTNYDEFIVQKIRKLGYKVNEWSRGHVYSISKLYGFIKELGLENKKSDEKFIPDCYKWASIEDRIELVRGLMDTDGFVDKKGRLVFYTTSFQLAEDLKFVLRSLGARVMISEKNPFYRLPDGTRKEGKKCYVLYILSKHNEQFVSLPRKKERIHQTKNSFDQLTRKIVKIEEIGEDEMACISVDNPNGLYIAGKDLIVTHNSRSLRWTILYWLLYWGAKGFKGVQGGLFCKTYPELNDRHLKRIKLEFPEWLGTYYEQKHEFHLKPEYGGGILMFRNLDEPEKYRSSEWAIVGIDELVQIPKETFDLILERNRWAGIENPKCIAVSNPLGEFSDWVREFFIEKTSKDKRCKEAGFLKAERGDNPYISESYYEELSKGMDEKTKKALLDGDWYALQGEMDTEGYMRLITSQQLNDAIIETDYPLTQPCIIGVDVGAGGDATAIVVRDQLTAKVLFNQRLSDTMAILPKIAEFYSIYTPRTIAVDVTGVGKGIYDRLNETRLCEKTYGVVFGSKADEEERFFNKKAQLYWKAREWILKGGKLIKNDAWEEALTIRYKIHSDRKIKMEPKENLLKKGIASPNVWDAFALTFVEDLNQMKFYENELWT